MSDFPFNIPEDLLSFVLQQKKEFSSLSETIKQLNKLDEPFLLSFKSFVEHRIDDQLHRISDYLNKNPFDHQLTPKEIDTILHYLLKDFCLAAQLSSLTNPSEKSPKRLILNWLKNNLLTAYQGKDSLEKTLSPLFRLYVTADPFEKEGIYKEISKQLLVKASENGSF